jgi:signal transduction histidine kinase
MKLAVQHLHRAWHDGASQIGEIVEKVTHTLIDQIDSLSRISDEFSRFARMPRRSTAQVDAGATLREAVALFGSHEEVQFSLRIEDGLPPVMADREELARAFANLLRNALQATRGSIAVSAAGDSEGIRILISDTGVGIPPELLPRIFEPNFSTKTEGMGLGLAIVKKIIDDAGGTIMIESTPGEGTTVVITLPVS